MSEFYHTHIESTVIIYKKSKYSLIFEIECSDLKITITTKET
jgi:hypothetical protein